MRKQYHRRFLAIALILSMLFSLAGPPAGFADTSLQNNDEGIDFSAGLYLDANRTQLETELTSDGATLDGWGFISDNTRGEDRYLGIAVSGMEMDNAQYQVVIEMDPILFVNTNTIPEPASTTVFPKQNSAFTVNTDGSYTPNEFSFENLTYLMDTGTSELTIGIPINYDVNLWNKQNGGALGNGTDPLLRVYLQKKTADEDFETVGTEDVWLKQATVNGKISFSGYLRMYTVGGSGTETQTMGRNDALEAFYAIFAPNGYTGEHYAKNVKLTVKVPSCEVNGTKHFLAYSDYAFQTSGGSSLFEESFDEETGILTLTGSNFYFNRNRLARVVFSAPETLKSTPGTYQFSGNISAEVDGVKVSTSQISIKVDMSTNAILESYGATGKANIIERDVVQYLGSLAMKNSAALENGSGPMDIRLSFDTNNTNSVNITTVNLMGGSGPGTITVKYTLNDENGNPAFVHEGENQVFEHTVKCTHNFPAGKAVTGHYHTLKRSDLPQEHRAYYFETISYTMENMPGNSFGYNSSAGSSPSSGGTIWGYVTTDKIPAVMPIHRMEVYQRDTETQLLTRQVTTAIDAQTTVSYGISSAAFSATSVTAGDSVTLSGKVFVPKYPYSSNSCLNDIRLGIVLPEGITVNASSITASATGGALAVKKVSSRAIGNGNSLHIIEFEQGQKIGYFNESLGALSSGSEMSFKVQLNSEKTISTQTISFTNSVFVAGLNRKNGAGGSYSVNSVTDVYDLNENGSTTDKIGCMDTSKTPAEVTFQASPAELVITDRLVNEKGESESALTLDSFADKLTYNLDIACTQGGSASDFYYYIPIPRTTMTSEDSFVKLCQVDVGLAGEPILETKQGTAMKLEYTTAPITAYSSTGAIDDWSDTLPDGKTWSDVTMVKITARDSEIVNGSLNSISMQFKYLGDDLSYQYMAGSQIQWHSRGYYCYEVGYNSNAGTKSTEGCTITLTYTEHEPRTFTLTAAKGGNPIGDGAQTSYSFELPEFFLAQEYSVKQVTPYNVKLMDGEYDFSKASSTEANENFRIKISVKKNTEETGSTPISLQKDDDIIGNLSGKSAPMFTFSIENADALSDIVTERKVSLTLIGNNGVIVPVVITINRELAAAEPTASAIEAGKLYSPFEGGTSTALSCDSSFTAQFITQYIPANYTNRVLKFDKALPEGTKITLIDYTDPEGLLFYMYECKNNLKDIPLIDFVEMGTKAKFRDPEIIELVSEKLLFVVSLPEEGEILQTNTVTLTKDIRTGTDDTEPSTLTFTTVEKRQFDISSSKGTANIGESFSISYTSQCDVTDSRYTGRTLALVVRASSGNAFDEDACLTVNDQRYYLNTDGSFLIPLKDAQKGGDTVTVSYHSNLTKSTKLQFSLWASATANGSKPLMGNPVVATGTDVTVTAVKEPSFKITDMTARLLSQSDLEDLLTVKFDTKDVSSITLELQRKVSTDYVTQTTILEAVNGKTDAVQGVFPVDKNATKADVALSSNAPDGTYRLLFKVSSGGETITVPYNFIIIR